MAFQNGKVRVKYLKGLCVYGKGNLTLKKSSVQYVNIFHNHTIHSSVLLYSVYEN